MRNDTTFGIMKFTLHATSYDWVFLPIAGSTFTDSGTRAVHGAPPPPTTIGFRSAASAANATTTTLVLPRPAGTVSGDELLASVSVRGTPTITPPAGWTLVRRDVRTTTFTQAVYVHPAGASEPTSYTFTFDSSQTAVGAIAAYTGVDGSNPTAGDSGQANSGLHVDHSALADRGGAGNAAGGPVRDHRQHDGHPAHRHDRAQRDRVAGVTSKLTLSLDDQSNAASGASGDPRRHGRGVGEQHRPARGSPAGHGRPATQHGPDGERGECHHATEHRGRA